MQNEDDDRYSARRIKMVSSQLERRGIKDERVLEAMRTVPRHEFVPEAVTEMAYQDHPLPIGYGQTISQPYMVALMSEEMELSGIQRVLEVGTGSGYQAAILSCLAKEVITVERVPELAVLASERLKRLGYENVEVITGDGSIGYEDGAPYDGIMVTAGAPGIPEALKSQLGEMGLLVIPAGSSFMQSLIKIRRKGDRYSEAHLTGCVFVPLIGEQGWPDRKK